MRPKIILCLLTCLALSSEALAQTWYPITLSKINAKETRVGMASDYGATLHPETMTFNWHNHPTNWPGGYYIPYFGAGLTMPVEQRPHSTGAWATADPNYDYYYYRAADGKLRYYSWANNAWANFTTDKDANGPILGTGYDWYFYFTHDNGQTNWLRERHKSGSSWYFNEFKEVPRGTLATPAPGYYYLYYSSLYDRRVHAVHWTPATSWIDEAVTPLFGPSNPNAPRAVPNAQVAVESTYSSYFIGEDARVYWLRYTSPDGPWTVTALGTARNANTSTPGIAYVYSGTHRLYYKADDGCIWTFTWSGGAWTGPTPISQTMLMAPATQLSANPLNGDVFYVGRDNRVRGITTVSGRQMADVDTDGLPDSEDSGGNNPDRDGDGILDGVEASLFGSTFVTSFSPDNDNDGIQESFELFYGLSDSNAADAFGDLDGDRYPNVFEIRNGSDPAFAGSIPAPAAIADPRFGNISGTDKLHSTITGALAAAAASGGYPVVLVREGTYQEKFVIDDNLPVCIVGETTLEHPTVVVPYGLYDPAVKILNGQVCLDGLTITRASGTQGRGVSVEIPGGYTATTHAGTSRQVRLANLIVCDHLTATGAGVFLQNAVAMVAHCTLFDNYATSSTSGIQADGGSTTVSLVNSIVWNKPPLGSSDTGQYGVSGGATITPQNSIFYAVGAADPLLDRFGGLMLNSPAINAGSAAANMPATDVNGEPRNGAPDIGADERWSVNINGAGTIPDWWEYRMNATLTDPGLDSDSDGLTDSHESYLGTGELQNDTDGDNVLDGYEVHTSHTNPLVAEPDVDGDGLNAVWEAIYGTSDSIPDSNGDGIDDGWTVYLGFDPALVDSDGDGLNGTAEFALGTHPLMWDTDGDSWSDSADAFPLDPARWIAPAGSAGDLTAPQVFLDVPVNATPL